MAVNFVDEVLKQSFFGVREIGDDAILHGPHVVIVPRRSSEHLLCLGTPATTTCRATGLVLHGDD